MTDPKNNINILSLNVYHGQLSRELLAYVMSKSRDVSVFCLQETDGGVPKLLDSALSEDFSSYSASKTVGNELFSITTYVHRDLQVVSTQTIHAETPDTGLSLRCKLVDGDGRQVAVTNVYGNPRPGDKHDTPERLSLSRALVEMTRTSAITEVVAGDFNLLPDTESVQMFADSGFRNLIKEFEIPTTRNEIAWSKFPAHMKQLHADYAFVRGEGVDCSLTVEDVRVSDHLPLVVSLTQKTPSAEIFDSVSEPSRARSAV